MQLDPQMASAVDVLPASLTDDDLIARILAGERELFEIVMRRHNQRLYRAARAITRDEAEVEDILQQAYLNAFAHLRQFESRAQLSTWLTRIVINEAHARRRRIGHASYLPTTTADDDAEAVACRQPSPEQQAYAGELHRVLEAAVDELPDAYRVVFMLRDVEGMSTLETGAVLGLGDDASRPVSIAPGRCCGGRWPSGSARLRRKRSASTRRAATGSSPGCSRASRCPERDGVH